MSVKILPAIVAAALVATTAIASAQTRSPAQDAYRYTQTVAPGPDLSGGPFVGTFSEGLPYPGYYYGPGAYPYGAQGGYYEQNRY
jgi:hypothetical protein